jgi:hypothetical protein
MAFSRRLGVVWIAGASWLVAVGCDDSEDRVSQPARAGEAGEAPGGGTSAVAGSQNNGGKAIGIAGTAGESGMTSGGSNGGAAGGETSAGQAGVGGDMAGAAGVAGAAGEAGGGAGGAAGGQGGAGGEGGVLTTVVPHCAFSCDSDDDCVIEGDDSVKCNLTSHACEDPTTSCTVDAECLVFLTPLTKSCTSDTNCTAGTEACVEANGQGFCATLPSAGVPACTNSNRVPKTLPRVGAQGTVAVCAHADARCFNRLCRAGCGTTGVGCGLGNGDTCSATTGLCGCTSGTECDATGICGRNGRCQECKLDSDCAATIIDPVCIGGQCGCASATSCAVIDPGYDGAPAVCQ